jgi:hypothetical protein
MHVGLSDQFGGLPAMLFQFLHIAHWVVGYGSIRPGMRALAVGMVT